MLVPAERYVYIKIRIDRKEPHRGEMLSSFLYIAPLQLYPRSFIICYKHVVPLELVHTN